MIAKTAASVVGGEQRPDALEEEAGRFDASVEEGRHAAKSTPTEPAWPEKIRAVEAVVRTVPAGMACRVPV